jgi:anti-anti-sigma factor
LSATVEAIVLPLSGELCIAELPALRERLETLVAGGVREIVLDLTDVTLLTAAALRVFGTTEQRLREHGGTLKLRNPGTLARRVLEITGFGPLTA